MESVLVAPDGSFWLSDEYRPAIYHFDASGVLINRLIPEGTAESVGHPRRIFWYGDFTSQCMPSVGAIGVLKGWH